MQHAPHSEPRRHRRSRCPNNGTLSTRYGPLDMRTFQIEPDEADDERALSNKIPAWLETTSLDAGDTITIEKAHVG